MHYFDLTNLRISEELIDHLEIFADRRLNIREGLILSGALRPIPVTGNLI
jgi:hypothetical protein